MFNSVNLAARFAAILVVTILTTVSLTAQPGALEQARTAVAEGDFTTAARLYVDAMRAAPRDRTILIEAGDVHMELDRYNEAKQFYQTAVELDKKDVVAIRKYGIALSALGDHGQAIESIKRAMKLDENSLENSLALAQAYLNVGRDSLSRAEITILAAQKKYPESPATFVALGDLYFARGVYELSQMQFEEALKRDGTLIEPRVKLGRSYREMAKRTTSIEEATPYYNKALVEFNTVTGIAPKNARAWLEQGEILMLAERFEDAGRSFEAYTKLRPEDPRGDLKLAEAAFKGNFFLAAITPLERILSRSDSLSRSYHDQARVMLAKSYYANKQYDQAVKTYAQIADASMDSEALNLYGSSILMAGGDTTKALTIYRQLMEKKPEDCALSMNLGNLLFKRKMYDDVIDVFTKRMVNCPTEPAATPNLFMGLSHYALKRYDQAIQALERSIAADSSYSQSYYWLLNVYAQTKQQNKVVEIARLMDSRDFVKTMPKEMSQAYLFLGKDRFDAKDYKGALNELERSVKANPENATAYIYMAFSYQLLNDKDNACKYYRTALKYDPNNADAKKNLKALGCE